MKKVLSMALLWVLLLSVGIPAVLAGQVFIPNQNQIILESIGDPETVDPSWAYDTASAGLIFHVYETLIDFDLESVERFVPELATEWTVSPDGLTYTFKIREGVKFHDGSIMTTEDVEYSFEHILVQDRSGGPEWMFFEPLFGVYHNHHLGDIKNPDGTPGPDAATVGHMLDDAVQRNDTHVWFNLAMPYQPFLQILSQSWASILNKDFCIANGDWPGWEPTYTEWVYYDDPATAPLDVAGNVMSGTGPYMLDYWTHGVEWSIVKFDDYWRGWPAPHAARSTERITEKVVYEWETRLADFRAGTADMVYVPRAYISQVEDWPGIRGIKDLPTLSADAALFNFNITMPSPYVGSGALDGNGIPPDFFSDIHVRKAFAYAFNHTKFIEEIFLNEAETPPTPHIKGLSYSKAVWDGTVNPKYGTLDPVPIRDIDLAKVEEEMKLAFGGAVWTNGFKMTIAFNAGNVPRQTAALMFKENLESLNSDPTFGGCTIDTVAVTWSTYLGEIWYYPTYRSILPLYIMGWSADYPDPHNFVMPFQHSEGELASPSSYSNETVDGWIEAGIVQADQVEREYLYWKIAWSYYHDVPSICLAQPLGRHWERDWVQGWYYNTLRGGSLAVTTGCASTSGLYFYHMWKGLLGDINGDNSVDFMDLAMINAHWSNPPGLLGYDRIADIWPELQYIGDLDPSSYLPQDEYGVPFPSIGEVDIYDWAALNQLMRWDPAPSTTPGPATLYVDPAETVTTNPFYIDIYVDDVENMWAFQIKVAYDTDVLTATDFYSWMPFSMPLGPWTDPVTGDPTGGEINDAEGYVKMIFSYPMAEHLGLTTTDPILIASIDFSVDAAGASPLNFVDSSIGNIYGEWISHVAICGEFRTDPGLPLAKFTSTPETPIVGETVTFASFSTDPDGIIVAWDWDFGDGTTGTGETATHTYTDPGDYTVTLTVTDNDGNTDTHSDIITIRERVGMLDWPMRGYDPASTSYSPSSAPNTNATAWVSDLPGGTVWSYPLVAEGKVFIGTGGNFTAWDENTGSFLWGFRAPAQPGYPVTSAVADGMVFFGTAEPGPGGSIYALDATTGEEIWNFTTEGYVRAPPVVTEGRLYIGGDLDSTGKLYCINATNGESIWNYTTQDRMSSVAVAYSKVYASSGHWQTSTKASIYSLDMYDGSLVWRFDTRKDLGGGLSVAGGKVYFVASDEGRKCEVYALNATNGDVVWSTTRYSNGEAGGTAVAYGKVFISLGYDARGVYALNETTGDEIWAFPTPTNVKYPVVADGKVFFTTSIDDNKFYALNETNGAVVWSYTHTGIHSLSSAVANGRVFIATHFGQPKLYAFGPYMTSIEAYCFAEGSDISVSITIDGAPTGYNTPYTFMGLTGTHTFAVPDTDPNGHSFVQWNTGETSATITVNSGGIYIAYYEAIHDVAIIDITAFPTHVPRGELVYINVTVENQGNFTETFDVIVYADKDKTVIGDEITVGMQTIHNLPAGTSQILDFIWDTTDVPLGNYWISAEASVVPGETDTADNLLKGGVWVGGIYAPPPPPKTHSWILIALTTFFLILIGTTVVNFFKNLIRPKLGL